MKNLFIASIASTILLASCGGTTAPKEENKLKQPEKTSEVCSYSYNHSASSLKWTAYKTTEKIGVSGTFNEITVNNTTTSQVQSEVIGNLVFSIPVSSVNTSNEDRDGKIVASFFGAMIDTETIFGKVVELTEDGKCKIMITMNEIEQTVEGTYKVEGQEVSLEADIDLANWNGNDAIASLNKVCDDLHKGADGISKLWPNVKLNISTTLDKNCK